MAEYILSVDQSTQGTKGLLFDAAGALLARADRTHEQYIDERGWVEHDGTEILKNTLTVTREVIEKAGVDKNAVRAMGISNQRETVIPFDRKTGVPLYHAVVWQCSRGKEICAGLHESAETVRQKTGLALSPYFSASKLAWLMQNVPTVRQAAAEHRLALSTIDTFLLWHLTREHIFATEYSNAARTQLFNLNTLSWDEDLCTLFGVPRDALADVRMSDSAFGTTDLDGYLETPIPICGVLGDSNGALYGQGCHTPGSGKATYGTGSSVMMNLGKTPHLSSCGLVTSLAWGMGGKVAYVLEGNLNYTGAVIRWLREDVGLIQNDAEATALAETANPTDRTCCVPAFTGLGAPYWDSEATALLTGMTRTTGRAEIAKAALDCIAYQITDLVELMRGELPDALPVLRADGGPTASGYLMQLQSDLSQLTVEVPEIQELSGLGAAYAAGISAGVYDPETIFQTTRRRCFTPQMPATERNGRCADWKAAVRQALTHP